MQRKKRSSLVSNYKLVLLMDAAGKCFDEKECYRNKMKRRRVFLKRPSKGKKVCPPAPRWELGAATVQQGTPTCGHTGMELVHERCPEREKNKSTVTIIHHLFTFDTSNDATM